MKRHIMYPNQREHWMLEIRMYTKRMKWPLNTKTAYGKVKYEKKTTGEPIRTKKRQYWWITIPLWRKLNAQVGKSRSARTSGRDSIRVLIWGKRLAGYCELMDELTVKERERVEVFDLRVGSFRLSCVLFVLQFAKLLSSSRSLIWIWRIVIVEDSKNYNSLIYIEFRFWKKNIRK